MAERLISYTIPTMPALSDPRQPALDWFVTEAGQGLLAVESGAIARVLAACPALPWAWLGVRAATQPEAKRGIVLRRNGRGFTGALRCELPLPLASESLGAIMLQHALDDAFEPEAVLDECARVLVPGGTLWLATLNPWSPYRIRWARTGLHARDPGRWQRMMRDVGFATDTVSLQWLGPHWRIAHGDVGVGMADRLRAGVAMSVSKRVHAVVPPAALRRLRWQAGGAG